MKILIVDDQETICQSIRSKILRIPNHSNDEVLYACTVEAGMELFHQNAPDIVITDINMPVKQDDPVFSRAAGGLRFIEGIRKKNEHTVILVLSGYDDYDYVRKSFLLGANDYLLKPLSISELEEKLMKYEEPVAKEKPEAPNKGEAVMPEQKSYDRSIMDKAIRYIEENINNDISMLEVSEFVSVSYTYFSRIFKEYTGSSFPAFLLQKRMEKAKEYLAEPDVKIQEIAKKLGYKSPSLFSRAFKKYTGFYPIQYRYNRNKE